MTVKIEGLPCKWTINASDGVMPSPLSLGVRGAVDVKIRSSFLTDYDCSAYYDAIANGIRIKDICNNMPINVVFDDGSVWAGISDKDGTALLMKVDALAFKESE